MSPEEIRFASADGTLLEGELAAVPGGRAAVVLCHPHPQYGGSMRAPLVGDLFRALPEAGVSALRFNFRGVEHSAGAWDEGRREPDDAAAALATLADTVQPATPVVLAGWSFGGDMCLSVPAPRVAGWCAIAPPLHYATHLDAIGADPRPKHLILGARDDVVSADRVAELTGAWAATTLDLVPGADHFFVGSSAQVEASLLEFLDAICG